MKDIKIRNMIPADHAFILDSWLNSYCDSSEFAKSIDHETFFSMHRKIVEGILSRPTTTVLIAHVPDADDVIIGYAVFEKLETDVRIVHYVYVKRAFGKFGVAKELIKNAPFELKPPVYASHKTYKGRYLIDSHKFIYSPYMT